MERKHDKIRQMVRTNFLTDCPLCWVIRHFSRAFKEYDSWTNHLTGTHTGGWGVGGYREGEIWNVEHSDALESLYQARCHVQAAAGGLFTQHPPLSCIIHLWYVLRSGRHGTRKPSETDSCST